LTDRLRTLVTIAGLLVLCYVLFQFGNGAVSLTDPDDVFYADTAKEMLAHHSWLTPIMFDQPQFEKPPLYYWLLMFAFQLFGVTAWAARLVGVITGFGAVATTYLFARKVANDRVGLISSIVLATSIWWIGLARVVLTDLLFSVLFMGALYAFLIWYRNRRSVWLWTFGLCTGLAALAKSPIGLGLAVIIVVVFLILERDLEALRKFLVAPWWLLCLAIAAPWYWYEIHLFGSQFTQEFLIHDHWDRLVGAEHKEFNRWYFYLVAVGFGFIPWTAFAPYIRQAFGQFNRIARFLVIWIVVVGVFFTLAQSKLTTYVSPMYPALAVLVALGLAAEKPYRWVRNVSAVLLLALAGGLGAGAYIVAQKYAEFATGALWSFGSLAVVLVIAAVLLLMKRKSASIWAAAGGIALFSILAATTVFGKLEGGLTQANLVPIIERHAYHEGTVLSSKLFARGIRFYTGCQVMVIAESPQPYWSSHPIPVISVDDSVKVLLASRDTLICVLSNGDLNRVKRLLPEDHLLDTLASDMGKSVVVSRRRYQ
jgi:4-amino-4-deoxy-L-arabinose transferase-like glycosyltransferase